MFCGDKGVKNETEAVKSGILNMYFLTSGFPPLVRQMVKWVNEGNVPLKQAVLAGYLRLARQNYIWWWSIVI